METDAQLARKAARERAEAGEGAGGRPFVVTADGGGGERLGLVGRQARGGVELPLRGDAAADSLERHAVQDFLSPAAAKCVAVQPVELLRWREAPQRRRRVEAGHERRQPARRVREEEVAGADGREGVGL